MKKEINQEKVVIRSELNIEKWPIFTTSTYKGKSKEIVRTIKLANGDIEERKVIIGKINNVEVGVFRIFDFKGFCALIKIWERQGRPANRSVYFSVHEIAEILNLTWGGKTYHEIKSMLMRLRKIPIDWVNSFYNRELKQRENLIESFNILSDLKIYEKGRRNGQIALALSSYTFDKRLVGNLLTNYSKPLLLDHILKFKKETSILLYRYLDLVMADKIHFERNSKELIAELDLSQEGYPYPAQRKKLLEPVLKEILGAQLSTGIIRKAELVKNKGEVDWKAVFDKEIQETIRVVPEPVKMATEFDPVEELVKRGITRAIAQKLVMRYAAELIREKIEVFDLLMAGQSSLVSKNPPGWLRSAIEHNYIAPANLETKEKKDKREKASKEKELVMENVGKAERYRSWLNSTPEQNIWWDLEKWTKEYKKLNGAIPSEDEIQRKKRELIQRLPTNEEMQIRIFGKVIYDKDGKHLKG